MKLLKKLFTITLLIFLVTVLPRAMVGCRKMMNTRGLTEAFLEMPERFPAPRQQFTYNPITKEGIELGRRLFYDEILSADYEHPCADCHEQKAAFGTFEHDRSHGVFDSHTLRNAPVLFNLAWAPTFHWDGEFEDLQQEAVHPITGKSEMGERFQNVIHKLENDPDYPKAFRKVFGVPRITPIQIVKALEQFTGTLVSAHSKYDQYREGTVPFTTEEESGYQLFRTHCNSCHVEPLFTDYSYRNIGLALDPLLMDAGRMRVTGNSSDSLKFKVPTLRNLYFSSNYMHDGRFQTVQQVIYHYRFGIQSSATLDPILRNGIQLTELQTNQLMAFLKTLSDSTFIRNPKLAKPE